MQTPDNDDDVPEAVQDIIIAASEQLRAAGVDDVDALHYFAGFALAMMPSLVCHEHLLEELAYIEQAIARTKTRILSGTN